MTFLRTLNPRNLLIILCAVALVLIGIKGINISRKINAYNQAEQLYAAEKLVEAEEMYQKAFHNRWFHYYEAETSARLEELAPITTMKQQLVEIQREAANALRQYDFDSFMDAYAKLQSVRNTYVGNNHPFEVYYRELSARYDISAAIVSGFEQFRQHYDEQMASNLEQDDYSDESFKNNLLRIPELYYGGSDKKDALLREKFQTYDARKLSRLGAAGQFDNLLAEALSTLELYKQLDMDAPWVGDTVESIVKTVLEKDAEQHQVQVYITHAKDYIRFAEQAELDNRLTAVIDKQIGLWMKEAAALSADGQYEQAIQLYTVLGNYQDTKAEIEAVNIAWMGADPLRLLQRANADATFSHVVGGTDRYGAKVYAAAVDENNRVYFATWNGGEESIDLLSDDVIAQGATIAGFTIDETLSTNKRPVLMIESSSDMRFAQYTIVQVKDKSMKIQLQVDADQLEIVEAGKLIVTNPNIAGAEGGIATYRLLLGEYRLFKVEQAPDDSMMLPPDGSTGTDSDDGSGSGHHGSDSGSDGDSSVNTTPPGPTAGAGFTDITVEELSYHRYERVRFNCAVVEGGAGVVYGIMGDSYVMLNGNVSADSGSVTVIGTYTNTTDVQIGQKTIAIPVFDIDTIEQ